jgi:UDP-glucuronate decarboxylase
VDDLVRGLIALMDAPDSVTGPINLGNPGEFTILELAEKVVAMTGSRSKIDFHPLPQDDPTQRCPDITRARKHLDWQPATQLEAGLRKTITYFDELLRKNF